MSRVSKHAQSLLTELQTNPSQKWKGFVELIRRSGCGFKPDDVILDLP